MDHSSRSQSDSVVVDGQLSQPIASTSMSTSLPSAPSSSTVISIAPEAGRGTHLSEGIHSTTTTSSTKQPRKHIRSKTKPPPAPPPPPPQQQQQQTPELRSRRPSMWSLRPNPRDLLLDKRSTSLAFPPPTESSHLLTSTRRAPPALRKGRYYGIAAAATAPATSLQKQPPLPPQSAAAAAAQYYQQHRHQRHHHHLRRRSRLLLHHKPPHKDKSLLGRIRRFPLFLTFVLGLISLLGVGVYFGYDSIGATQVDLERERHLTSTQIGILFAVYSAPTVVTVIITGSLADRVGVNAVSILSCVAAVLGSAIIAFFERSFWGMIIGRVIQGVGSEALLVTQQAMLCVWFKSHNLNLAFGVATAVTALGSTLSFLVLTWVTHHLWLTLALWIVAGVNAFTLLINVVYVIAAKRKLKGHRHYHHVLENENEQRWPQEQRQQEKGPSPHHHHHHHHDSDGLIRILDDDNDANSDDDEEEELGLKDDEDDNNNNNKNAIANSGGGDGGGGGRRARFSEGHPEMMMIIDNSNRRRRRRGTTTTTTTTTTTATSEEDDEAEGGDDDEEEGGGVESSELSSLISDSESTVVVPIEESLKRRRGWGKRLFSSLVADHIREIRELCVQFWILCAFSLLFCGSIYPFFGFSSMFLVEKYRFRHDVAGQIVAMADMMVVLAPLVGIVIDRIGRRSLIFVSASVAYVACFVLLGVTAWNPIPMVIVAGILYSVLESAVHACVPLVIDEKHLGYAFGIMGGIYNLGLVATPPLVGWLREITGSYNAAMLLFAGMMAAALGCSAALWALDTCWYGGRLEMGLMQLHEHDKKKKKLELLEVKAEGGGGGEEEGYGKKREKERLQSFLAAHRRFPRRSISIGRGGILIAPDDTSDIEYTEDHDDSSSNGSSVYGSVNNNESNYNTDNEIRLTNNNNNKDTISLPPSAAAAETNAMLYNNNNDNDNEAKVQHTLDRGNTSIKP